MANEELLEQCYNRGCGQKYDPTTNTDGKKPEIRLFQVIFPTVF